MKGKQFKQMVKHVDDDAHVLISENPKALMIIQDSVCTMIKLDGNWERSCE